MCLAQPPSCPGRGILGGRSGSAAAKDEEAQRKNEGALLGNEARLHVPPVAEAPGFGDAKALKASAA